jgi:6-phosphogluconolactonase
VAVLTIANDEAALARQGADRITTIVAEAVRERGRALVSLTGGTTPRRTYEMLAHDSARLPWAHLHLFWGDERHVPPDHKDSNYGMARDALLAHVTIPPANVHRIRGELPADEAAHEYERELAGTFDLMLLGLGADAHIASIFPGSPVLQERERLVAAPWVAHLNAYRITLTPPALLDARRIVMLVAGPDKAGAVKAAIESPEDPQRWPVHVLRSAGDRVEWLIDRAAARALVSPRA